MGITGLLRQLSSITTPIHLKDLENLTVAVDAYVWLHKGAYACSSELCNDLPTSKWDLPSILAYSQAYKITPILVFDGGSLPSKQLTNDDRREKRQLSKKQADEHIEKGDAQAADNCFKRAVNVTSRMAYNLIQVLRREKIDFIVSPYEADAQLAFLSLNKIVDAVITEDSDLIVFGCSRVIFKLDKSGYGKQILLEDLGKNAATDMDLRDFTRENFRHMCILSGCDYLQGLPGFGLKTAHKYINQYKHLSAILKELSTKKKFTLPQNYQDDFNRANWTFLHQRVWDPVSRTLVPLTPFSDDFDQTLDFIGPDMDIELAEKIATDPHTKEPYNKHNDETYMRDANSYFEERKTFEQKKGQKLRSSGITHNNANNNHSTTKSPHVKSNGRITIPGAPPKSQHILNFFKPKPEINSRILKISTHTATTTTSAPTQEKRGSSSIYVNRTNTTNTVNVDMTRATSTGGLKTSLTPSVGVFINLDDDDQPVSASTPSTPRCASKVTPKSPRLTRSTEVPKAKPLTNYFSNVPLTPASQFLTQSTDILSQSLSQTSALTNVNQQQRRRSIQSQLSAFFPSPNSNDSPRRTDFYSRFSQNYSSMSKSSTSTTSAFRSSSTTVVSSFIDLTEPTGHSPVVEGETIDLCEKSSQSQSVYETDTRDCGEDSFPFLSSNTLDGCFTEVEDVSSNGSEAMENRANDDGCDALGWHLDQELAQVSIFRPIRSTNRSPPNKRTLTEEEDNPRPEKKSRLDISHVSDSECEDDGVEAESLKHLDVDDLIEFSSLED